nr:uncharacterized protein LOC105465213 isoform X3 [Macaca nemestrina]
MLDSNPYSHQRLTLIQQANWMSLGMMVTPLAWMTHRLVSSNRPTSLKIWCHKPTDVERWKQNAVRDGARRSCATNPTHTPTLGRGAQLCRRGAGKWEGLRLGGHGQRWGVGGSGDGGLSPCPHQVAGSRRQADPLRDWLLSKQRGCDGVQ